jgi:RNA polymerase sigma-70 factor, ECF subfamily
MSPAPPLAPAFLAALSEGQRRELEEWPRLEEQLAAAVQAATASWPGLPIEPEHFVAHLAARLPDNRDRTRPLASLRTDDLYLACACACGVAGATEAFETACMAGLDPAIARLGLDAARTEDVKQTVRRRLLLGEPGEPPLIARYAGRGPLPAWVRVVALRVALKQEQRDRREVALEDQVLDALPLGAEDPELDFIKQLYRGEFQQAFQEALRALSPRETNLILHHYLDGLTTRELASRYRVNQSTAARWLERARASLLEATRASLERRLGAGRSEVESIMRLAHSHLELTLDGLRRR